MVDYATQLRAAPSVMARVGLLMLTACAHVPASPELPPVGRRVELYFGRLQAQRPIDDAAFADFERAEIRARLPAGYTLLSGRGHWTSPTGEIADEPSTVLVVAFADPAQLAARDADLEAIRRAYCARFAQELVLRVDAPAALVPPH